MTVTVNVSTANGTVKAARVKLRSVDINGPQGRRDVSALVLPNAALSENLLGLSYLSRLKRYEFAGTASCDGAVTVVRTPGKLIGRVLARGCRIFGQRLLHGT